MPDLIEKYALDMERRSLSRNTISKRVRSLRLFESEVGFDTERESIEAWLDSRNLSPKSRAVWLSHLNCFWGFCLEHDHLSTNPVSKIRPPKLRRKLPRPMPDSDLQKALRYATPLLRAWLLLGALEGLRCQEIAGLRRDDVLVSEGLLRVVEAKGGDEGMLPLHPDVLEALETLGMPDRGPLFLDRFGRQISPGRVSHLLGDHLRGLGISSTPHSLRHFFGSEVMRATHDIRTTQELMRHKDISSTAIYTAFDQEAGRQAVAGLRIGA
jgi:integrase/recombinase XerD